MSREKVIGPFVFPTRKAAEQEIRRILHGSEPGHPLEGDDLALITGLLGCHPRATQKIGCGIRTIEVRRIEYGSPGFWITRIDGTGDDFSYRTALNGTLSRKAAVRAAMRHAIRPQVDAFRRSHFDQHADADGTVLCPLTGLRVRTSGAHVDHIEPFAELADRFVETCGGFEAIRLGTSRDHPGPALTNPVQRDVWQAYHAQTARLRVVHASANLARYTRRTAA